MSNCQATGAADVELLIAPGTGAASFAGTPSNGLRLFPNAVTLKETVEERVDEVMRASADVDADDIQEGLKRITGGFVLFPGQSQLDVLLPLMLGATEASDVFDIDTALNPFRARTRVGTVYGDFQDTLIDTWELSGSEGGSLRLAVECLGKRRVATTSAAHDTDRGTSVTPTADEQSIAFASGALSIDLGGSATSIPISEFRIQGNNNLSASFYSSQEAQCIDRDNLRALTFDFTIPLNATTAPLIGDGGSTNTGDGYAQRAASLSFATGTGKEFSLNMGAIQWQNMNPEASGSGKINFPLRGGFCRRVRRRH